MNAHEARIQAYYAQRAVLYQAWLDDSDAFVQFHEIPLHQVQNFIRLWEDMEMADIFHGKTFEA